MAKPAKNKNAETQTATPIALASTTKQPSSSSGQDLDFSAELIKQVNKDIGTKIMFNLGAGDAPTVVHRWISTGSRQLDYTISNLVGTNGGLPEGRIIEIQGPTGCHGAGDEVMMFDGSIKKIEHVKLGDKLMGQDSLPRTVLALHRGVDEMYQMIPARGGKPYQFTGNHTLVLKNSKNGSLEKILVKDWLIKSREYKRFRPLFRSAVKFSDAPTTKLPITPYVLGLLLGDGSIKTNRTELTTTDAAIQTAYTKFCNDRGYEVGIKIKKTSHAVGIYHKNGGNGKKLSLNEDTDTIRKDLRQLGILETKSGNKFIPDCYKFSSISDRLQLVAGLLDTDGHYKKQGNSFEYTTKSKQLATDLISVVRTCGLTASEPKNKTVKGTVYYRFHISGALETIPTTLVRKQAPKTEKPWSKLTSGFSLNHLGVRPYFGITVDKDSMYLGADTTVIHNCGKSHIAFEIAKDTQRKGGLVVYVDTENATSIENLEALGINVRKRFAFVQTSCTEEVFKVIEATILKARAMAADIPVTVIWDSVANTSPKAELEGDYDANTIGLQARVLGKGLRKITNVIGGQHVILVCLQQQREKIGVMYGDPSTTPGGKALPYASSVRIKVGAGKPILKTVDGKERTIGVGVTAKVIKNRMSPPFREVEFEIHFGKGVREAEQVFDYMREWCDKHQDNPCIYNGKRLSIAGTAAWKTFTIADPNTGEVFEEIKFYKTEFGDKVLYNPKYAAEITALYDSAYIMRSDDTGHATFAGVDTTDAADVEAANATANDLEV